MNEPCSAALPPCCVEPLRRQPCSAPARALNVNGAPSQRTAARGPLLLLLLLPVSVLQHASALDNGVGRTPPMGFNNWNFYGCQINESVILESADRLTELGLAAAGYRYVNIDDCWQKRSRGQDGLLREDPARFPSGIAALAQAVHHRGLLFGMYSDAGLLTCAGFPGSRFHEDADATLFAAWGVDYLKYDNCFAGSADIQERYSAMRDALNATGRPIFYSMCMWGVGAPWEWGASVGNSWRSDADIAPSWDAVLRSLDNGAAGLGRFAGPGRGWNDPDMLEVGNGDLNAAQQRSHFGLWSLVKAPLLIGARLDALSPTSLAILAAPEVIAVNQDPLGVAGDIIWKEGPLEVWAGPLSSQQPAEQEARAVALFNRHHYGLPSAIRVTWAQLGLDRGPGQRVRVRDLYARVDLGEFEGGFEASVGCYDVMMLRVAVVAAPTAAAAAAAAAATPAAGGAPAGGGVAAEWLSRRWWRRVAAAVVGRGVAMGAAGPQRPQQQQQESSEGAAAGLGSAAASTWRPWHDPEAARLQARLREAAAAARRQQPHTQRQRLRQRAGHHHQQQQPAAGAAAVV